MNGQKAMLSRFFLTDRDFLVFDSVINRPKSRHRKSDGTLPFKKGTSRHTIQLIINKIHFRFVLKNRFFVGIGHPLVNL